MIHFPTREPLQVSRWHGFLKVACFFVGFGVVWAAEQPKLPQNLFFPFQAKPRKGQGMALRCGSLRAFDFEKALVKMEFYLTLIPAAGIIRFHKGMIGFDGRGWSRVASREEPTS